MVRFVTICAALIAISLASVSGAAATPISAAPEYPVSLEAYEFEEVSFDIKGLPMKCGETNLFGTLSEESASVPMEPWFSSCSLLGFGVSVNTTGCYLVLQPGEETAEDVFAGAVEVDCEGGEAIVFSTLGCELELQDGSVISSAVQYRNEPIWDSFALDFGGSAVLFQIAKKCLIGEPGPLESTLKGEFEVISFNEFGQQQVRVGRDTRLCKKIPTGTPLECKVGDLYEGNVKGTLQAGKAATFKSEKAPKGEIVCKEALLVGTGFKKTGLGGSVTVTFGACESKLAKLAKPKVVLLNQPFNISSLEYRKATPTQGSIRMKSNPYAKPDMKLEGEGLECTYDHELREGPINNGTATEKTDLRLGRQFGLEKEVPGGGGNCPPVLNWEVVFDFQTSGGGEIYIANKAV